MKKHSIQLAFLLGMATAFLAACREDIVASPVDPDVQLREDLEIISGYMDSLGYEHVDTTASGVRYVVLDSGSGVSPAYGDIVFYHYTGRLTDGHVFDTSIDTVAQNNDFYDSTRVYSPRLFTYTSNGWPLTTIRGFTDGLTAVTGVMKVGGKSVIMIPSGLAYGTNSEYAVGIPNNSVLIFDIYITRVK